MARDFDIPRPTDFANEVFARNNESFLRRYAKLRISGLSPIAAMRTVFGEDVMTDNLVQGRIYGLEGNPVYIAMYKRELNETKLEQMWEPRVAIVELLSLVRDKFEKGSTRLRAIQDLNVLYGITITDENGKTKAGRSLADFYAKDGEKIGATPLPGESAPTNSPTTH